MDAHACSRAPWLRLPPPGSGELRSHHVPRGPGSRLRAQGSSGAATCPMVPAPASGLRAAPGPPRAPWLQLPSPGPTSAYGGLGAQVSAPPTREVRRDGQLRRIPVDIPQLHPRCMQEYGHHGQLLICSLDWDNPVLAHEFLRGDPRLLVRAVPPVHGQL
jgi:hypothetical protein